MAEFAQAAVRSHSFLSFSSCLAISFFLLLSFLWIVLLMNLSFVDAERIGVLGSVYAIPWLFHLGYLFGLPLLAQQVRSFGLVAGVWRFVKNLALSSVYYLFMLRAKSTGVQSGFHGGSASYRGTGRSFGLAADTLLTLYQQYARTHYAHAMQLLSLLLVYILLLSSEPLHVVLLKCYAVLLACFSWLLAPALFTPSFCLSGGSAAGIHAQKERERVWQEKKGQMKEVWAWTHRPFGGTTEGETSSSSSNGGSNAGSSSAESSWQSWEWDSRFSSLQLRAVRRWMYSGGGKLRQWQHDPFFTCAWEVLMRAVEWIPWIFLAVALLIANATLLPAVLLYLSLLALLQVSPLPRAAKTILVVAGLLLYFSAVRVVDVREDPLARVRQHNACSEAGC